MVTWRRPKSLVLAPFGMVIGEVIARHLETHTQFSEVFKFIETNLGFDLRIASLAAVYGISQAAFSMAFKRSTGMSPKD